MPTMKMVFDSAHTMVLFVLVVVVALFMVLVFLYFFQVSKLLCSDLWFNTFLASVALSTAHLFVCVTLWVLDK